ncbi:MAG: hypothetical protein ABR551_03270 [Gemmatimonadales bacterium]
MHPVPRTTRRALLTLLATAAGASLLPPPLRGMVGAARWHTKHPEPRPNYTADKVLKADQLGGDEELIALFDAVRKVPHIIDGIRCSCGCAELPGFYSLLTCFEGDNSMSKWCPICIGLGSFVVRLHGRGRTLAQIREAVDARY